VKRWSRNGYGTGIVAGKVSGNLEVIDFDDPAAFELWKRLVGELGGADLLKMLVIVETPTGGFHVYYRCSDGVEGNQKLAQRRGSDGKLRVLIETRGEGGYVIAPGSPRKCHPLRKSYKLLEGDLAKIPTTTSEERELLLSAARALNEYIEPKRFISGNSDASGNRPGDDFNARASWDEILEPHDWRKAGERGEGTDWRRPGKEIGISATTNHAGMDLFYNFSTNGHPFEAETGYTKFAAYTFLNHGGDFSAAAADLAEKGYGKETSSAYSAYSAPQEPDNWPQPLSKEAFHGLTGDIVRAIEPHTEADPAALMIQFLTTFGNVAGRKAHFMVEATPHHTNLFAVLVGDTAKSRKGTSWGHIKRLFEEVASSWVSEQIKDGLSSGEGLIWAVRDPVGKDDSGVHDKRLLVVETEYASTLRVLKREGNTLSPVIRNAWDSGDLNILTKNSPAKATDAHITIIGHITKQELIRYLSDTEAGNGFGNRFLWVCVTRSKCLPEGGHIDQVDLTPLTKGLREALKFAHKTEEIKFDEEARSLWYEVYPKLSEGKSGLLGAMIARAEAQVIRLSVIYALLDLSTVIQKEHLEAALAVWRYCEDSCRYIFGKALGDPVADDLLRALRSRGSEGMSRTEMNRMFKGHTKSTQIERALGLLEELGSAKREIQETEGRPLEVWFAT